MNPAWSVVFFTVLAGFGQGLAVVLAFAVMAGGMDPHGAGLSVALVCSIALMLAGLASSFLHLGHPMRAWRAASMWRTSWLSREVITMPAFIGWLVLWWLEVHFETSIGPLLARWVLPIGAILLAALLWLCTGMIYACIRFIREWSHPITLWYYLLTGLASGVVLAACIAAASGEQVMLLFAGRFAWAAMLAAAAIRFATLVRNGAVRMPSTLQSATGIRAARLTQMSMGMSAGSFNTREFSHGRTPQTIARVTMTAVGAGFMLPLVLAVLASVDSSPWLWAVALASQAVGLIADRWLFFAQARHPQSLYYQKTS
jgi:sulfite dehydrogenase (quinone) subunit SoeC